MLYANILLECLYYILCLYGRKILYLVKELEISVKLNFRQTWIWVLGSSMAKFKYRCKMTSHNGPSEAQIRYFLFHRKVMFCSRDIQAFIFLIIPRFTKSVTSWWVLVRETVHFWIYLLNHHTLKPTKFGQLIDISNSNIFLKSFKQLKDWG